ncbi:MAG: YlxR family protein [Peptococcaceae bacterium]|jgi:predicted RNA-binding protein YlxR (DUF448 family)|nr:YlxR family protein [Peptococcaceae bacterium]
MKARKVPMRMCLGCQQMKAKKELIRIVRTTEGNIEIDPTGKRNGRGTYICPQRDCLQNAWKGHRLQKAFQMEVPNDLLIQLEGKLSS